jgi:hypothetical protein
MSIIESFSLAVSIVCMAAGAGDPVQAEFDRVAEMSRAEQQVWLMRLERRAIEAARGAMSVEEAAGEQKRVRAMLHQKMVTWKVLREVIAETQKREKAAETKASHAEHANQGAAERRTAKPVVKEPIIPMPPSEPSSEAMAKPAGTPDAVKVNVEELETRIAAYNLAFRELEADWVEKGEWNAGKLEPLVDRLKGLMARQHDLGLIRDVVPKEQRAGITQLEVAKSAISEISARVVDARNRANDPKFGNETERQAELTRLEAVSRRLAELAEKK